jgi:hypothetical protein
MTKDIDETIGDSQLDKLMGVETKPKQSSIFDTDYSHDTWLDDIEEEDTLLTIPDSIRDNAYDKPATKKVKVAKPKPSHQATHSRMTTDEINRLIESSFASLMKPLDDKRLVIADEHYFGLRQWLRDCIKTGVIYDPDTSQYYSPIKEVE